MAKGKVFNTTEMVNEYNGGDAWKGGGTSIFDPVLCELLYSWFCPKGGSILDPFAGGSVRGIVAEWLGFKYTGIDLSKLQIEANEVQAKKIGVKPRWICGDSLEVLSQMEGVVDGKIVGGFDFIFSCPPYGDLEVYSEDPSDLSTMEHSQFLGAYSQIIHRAVKLLKPNRFACFVVSDFRDADGFYRNFPADTIRFFEGAGARLYNEAILINAIGSLPLRVGKQFNNSRKLGKTHQNVLIFFKGDPKTINETLGDVVLHGLGDDGGDRVVDPES